MTDDINNEEIYWVTGIVFWTIGSIVSMIICIAQGYAMYSDIYTSDRKILSHLRKAPAPTSSYKSLLFVTYISVITFMIANVTGIWGHFTSTVAQCYGANLLFSISFQIAKCSMYCLFLLRLHVIYSKSVYGYNAKILLSIGSVAVIVTIIIIYGYIVGTESSITSYPWSEAAYFCNGSIPFWVLVLIGLIDIVLSIGCLIAFILPLRKTLKAYLKNSDGEAKINKTVAKMIFTGYKYMIITCAATVSTLLVVLVFGGTGIAYLSSIDFVINSICLVLMTVYWPNHKYYTKLCCCCIACCDRKGYSKRTNWEPRNMDNKNKDEERTTNLSTSPSDNTNTSGINTKSVDTDVAVQHVANQQPKTDENYSTLETNVEANQNYPTDNEEYP